MPTPEKYTDFEAHVGMPASDSVLYYWKMTQISNGHAILVAKIEKESESNEGGTMWRDKQDSRIAFRKRIVSLATTRGRSSSQSSKHMLVCLWEAPNYLIGKWLSWAIDLLVWFLRLRKRVNRMKRAQCGMIGGVCIASKRSAWMYDIQQYIISKWWTLPHSTNAPTSSLSAISTREPTNSISNLN